MECNYISDAKIIRGLKKKKKITQQNTKMGEVFIFEAETYSNIERETSAIANEAGAELRLWSASSASRLRGAGLKSSPKSFRRLVGNYRRCEFLLGQLNVF